MKTLIIAAVILFQSNSAHAEARLGQLPSVFISKENYEALQLNKAKCAFLTTGSFTCVIPFALPKNSEQFIGNTEPSLSLRFNDENLAKLSPLFDGRFELSMDARASSLTLKVDHYRITNLLYSAYRTSPDMKSSELRSIVEQKTKEIRELAVDPSTFSQGEDSIRLKFQRETFAPFFAIIAAGLKIANDQKRIGIFSGWRFDFSLNATQEMIKSYCDGRNVDRESEKACEAVRSR